MALLSCDSTPSSELNADLSRVLEATFTRVWERALEISMAERLHDLARNSIDSVGVSGGGADDPSVPLTIPPFSSMFSSTPCSSPFVEHFKLQELTITKTHGVRLHQSLFK
ncbi:hypothetical protein FF2_016671 [Malus domestica]